MIKPAKTMLKVLLWIVGVAVALVLTLPIWIGVVVKPVANMAVSSKTGTGFNLGEFGLNQYSGRLTVGDMQLENPEGCSQKMAATLGRLHVDVDMGTVLSDTIVVEDIVLKDVFVSYVSNDKGENNFTVIQRNASGGKSGSEQGPAAAEKEPETSDKPAKKVIIDHLLVENVLVQWGVISIPLPKIELRDIGRQSNGTSLAEAWEQVSKAVMQALASAGANISGFVDSLGKSGMEQTLKAVDAAKSVDVKCMTDAISGGASLVNDAAGKSLDAVGESTGKAVDAIKGLFK